MRLTAYTDLRRQAPRLALALLFQTEKQKQQLSFLLLFGLELDRLSTQASEPMLALIRLKWWEDQLEAKTDEAAGPLAGLLHQQLDAGHLAKTDIVRLITCWAEAVQAGQTDRSENWAEVLHLMAVQARVQPSDLPHQIGRAVAQSRAGQPIAQIPTARAIYQTCGNGSEFLICLAYLSAESQRRDLNRSPFLIFGLLRQVLFKPASR